jgi:hypothetical protein
MARFGRSCCYPPAVRAALPILAGLVTGVLVAVLVIVMLIVLAPEPALTSPRPSGLQPLATAGSGQSSILLGVTVTP